MAKRTLRFYSEDEKNKIRMAEDFSKGEKRNQYLSTLASDMKIPFKKVVCQFYQLRHEKRGVVGAEKVSTKKEASIKGSTIRFPYKKVTINQETKEVVFII